MSSGGLSALELFAGIGGFSVATEGFTDIVGAIDMSSHTLSVLRCNFPETPVIQRNVETFDAAQFEAMGGKLWWMSPPCQPYTVRGLQKDLEDHRARAFLHLVECIQEVRPWAVAMENVKGYWDSQARQLLARTLVDLGYEIYEEVVCPTELGIPAKRERYYLVAVSDGLAQGKVKQDVLYEGRQHELVEYLDDEDAIKEDLYISQSTQDKFAHAMRIFDRDERGVELNCFTSAYGKTFRYSGAYVRERDGRLRYFSSEELLRLLHFPEGYRCPDELTRKQRYRYIGNSLSIVSMKFVLSRVPGLEALGDQFF